MFKKILNLLAIACISNASLAQQIPVDSIFTSEGLILAEVKEIAPDYIKYSFPSETLVNAIYKNNVQKIRFNSGRVQLFKESLALNEVNYAHDFDKVSLTHLESEVKGLYKLDEVYAKAVGTTTLSNITTVKERAFRKLKIQAALLGGNVIYMLDQNTVGNQFGTEYQAGRATQTTLTGIVYSNNIPKVEEVTTALNNKKTFIVNANFFAGRNSTDVEGNPSLPESFTVEDFYQENGFVYIRGKAKGIKNDLFKVVSFKNNQMTLYWKDKKKAYNLSVDL
ncbi:hypothetical protein VB264_07220 [Arcicella aquatica]|uniref:Uncharacterized protein n=1 Tax=Arcicella aquatica TaxID=217141 RepID=A0ABU5QKJ1_9BACT|nr:hypothetical protein [Arcicella aquatica]MEA5257567.1 hypothetical protein [Arcicella aquatica]